MSDVTTRGPANPSRIIFVATALIGVAVGFGTADIRWFTLAVIASAALLCTGYGLIRRRLGWKPLNVEYLVDLMRVISPP
ncbi:hypothetical protein MKK88_09825 [Methylobacterium sp. E-005]|uniref:hypothetical protein n=1 Tax=Methylobacterium sp. E-005 TaxID=2836549 RepID=UPI001FB88498|nr:hypothetical protein [Methylobacterium sp. E-005]MCJ2086293.1 hypothetical protein [Methylobacterium sp. E-005]